MSPEIQQMSFSQDDTFDRLVRVPVDSLLRHILTLPISRINELSVSAEMRESFLNSFGWTYSEWLAVLNLEIVN